MTEGKGAEVSNDLDHVNELARCVNNAEVLNGTDRERMLVEGLRHVYEILRSPVAATTAATPSDIAEAWWPTVEAALELAGSQYRGNLGTRALTVAEAADRIPRPFRTKLAIAEAPHPAPPPSPSEENGGEASDEELNDLCTRAFESEPDVCKQDAACNRALYDLGKHHQSSADAATIAGLQKKLEAWEPVVRAAIYAAGRHFNGVPLELTETVRSLVSSAYPDMHRPEPGGGK